MTRSETQDREALRQNPRASLSAWLRYEDLVHAAYLSFPEPFIIESADLATTTLESRLRDAIRGAITFGYPCDWSDDLSTWWNQVIVKRTITPPKVIICKRETKGLPPVEFTTAENKTKLEFVSLTVPEWKAFITLINNGRIQGPVLVRDSSNCPGTETDIHLNVQLLTRPDGSTVIL